MNSSFLQLLALAALLATGCSSPGSGTVATDVPPERGTATYYWDQPATASTRAVDYDRALAAIQSALTDRMLPVDSVDVRSGVVTSVPTTASQWFEPWRQDNSTGYDVARASLATYRRTVRVEIARLPEGAWEVRPRVLVERQTVVGRRVSGVIGFRSFATIDQSSLSQSAQIRSEAPPSVYWTPVGRDEHLERRLASDFEARMRG
jgi:hypothetical protein